MSCFFLWGKGAPRVLCGLHLFAILTVGMESFIAKRLGWVALAIVILLQGCGDLVAGDPAADGVRFNGRFYYYYEETCKYDGIGPYGCGRLKSLSPSFRVTLRVDSDGFAKLTLDGDVYTYFERDYEEGYEPGFGSYFRFYESDGKLDVYRDGYTLAYWGNDGYVTFYYYDLPD